MYVLVIITFISFVMYNAAILFSKYGLPSLSSYMYGAVLSLAPFFILMLSVKIGLPKIIYKCCIVVSAIVVFLVAGLVVSEQAAFVVPGIIICFGVFSFFVFIFSVILYLTQKAITKFSPPSKIQ